MKKSTEEPLEKTVTREQAFLVACENQDPEQFERVRESLRHHMFELEAEQNRW